MYRSGETGRIAEDLLSGEGKESIVYFKIPIPSAHSKCAIDGPRGGAWTLRGREWGISYKKIINIMGNGKRGWLPEGGPQGHMGDAWHGTGQNICVNCTFVELLRPTFVEMLIPLSGTGGGADGVDRQSAPLCDSTRG